MIEEWRYVPGPGHNHPPEEIVGPTIVLAPDGWDNHMRRVLAPSAERVVAMTAQLDSILAQYPLTKPATVGGKPEGVELWDDELLGRLADIRADFRSVHKTILSLHVLEKEPVLRASKAIDGAKNALIDQIVVTDAKGKVQRGVSAPINRIVEWGTWYTDWTNAEKLQNEKAEAERKRAAAEIAALAAMASDDPEALDKAATAYQEAEQADAAVNAPAADRTRVHGVYGGVMSSRTTWQFIEHESELADLVAAAAKDPRLLVYLQFNASRIGYAVRSEKVRSVPGVVIKEVHSV